MSMNRLVHGIVSLDPPTIRCDDRTFTVTLTAEQIDLIVELLPQPLERELLEEDLSPTLRHEIEHDLERVNDILEILLDAKEARRDAPEFITQGGGKQARYKIHRSVVRALLTEHTQQRRNPR